MLMQHNVFKANASKANLSNASVYKGSKRDYV